MKNKFLSTLAIFAMLFTACDKPVDPPATDPEPEAPEVIDEFLTANPEGETGLEFSIVAEEAWTVEGEETYSWISVSPASGTGSGKLTFVIEANETDAERSAIYAVTEGEFQTYEIMITQAKKESNVNDDDLAFLKAIVEGNMLGEETPTVGNWYTVEATFPGITLEDKDGKLFITRIDGAPFTDLPTVMKLPEVTHINIGDNVALTGKFLPTEWDTPKAVFIRLAKSKVTGTIPAGLAASPVLVELYCDGCDLYGALPHDWASKTLKVVILANYSAPADTIEPATTEDNTGLGYMVPASLDVVLNHYNDAGELDNNPMYWHDKTQFKLGGVKERNWVGFENGWGQARYEKYDSTAVAGDKTTWSDYRLLVGDVAGGDGWAHYFSNVGYPGRLGGVPAQMMTWNQTDADAYTAKCKEARN